MNREDFTYLNVEALVYGALRVIPPTDRHAKSTLAYCTTEIKFFKDAKLLMPEASAWKTPVEQIIIRLHDLTEEGQDFIMSGAVHKWLGACDNKSNRMFTEKAATDEQRLEVYRDPTGLYKRLEKFRAIRRGNSH